MVGGGDGTLSQATHQLAHRDLCLGVLPLGTTNNFARSLGLPLHLPAALQILTEGKVADVDLGHVAGRHFANLTSLGCRCRSPSTSHTSSSGSCAEPPTR